MKWQVLMLSIATAFALVLGTTRWKARLGARVALGHAATHGHWAMIQADGIYNANGFRMVTGAGDVKTMPGTEKLGTYMVGGFDVLPDLSRIAWIDMQNYSEPQLKVGTPHHLDRPLAVTAAPKTGATLSCPFFESDGSVLFLQQSARPGGAVLTTIERAVSIPDRPMREPLRSATVPLDFGVASDDCVEESADGMTLAFVGTDHQIHLATRHGVGFRTSPTTFASADFELAPSGTWFATVSGGKLLKVNASNGATDTIADNLRAGRTLAISPDERWVAILDSGAMGGSDTVVYRVSDGAPVSFSSMGYTSYNANRLPWVALVK